MAAHYDLTVFGAGSGGTGAAISGARLGLSTLLVEKQDTIGGTAVLAGVHVWEPTAGSTGLPFDIYRRLMRVPNAVGIYSYGRRSGWHRGRKEPAFPGSEHVIDQQQRYINTLQKHGARTIGDYEKFCQKYFHGVVFEAEAYVAVAEEMLRETGRCTVLKNTTFTDVEVNSGQIASIRLDDGRFIISDVYVDCTGDGLLCSACGCRAMVGRESKEIFGEPDAPDRASNDVNGATLIYRITPKSSPGIDRLQPGIPDTCWWQESFPWVSAAQYPCGDYNMNMLPTMQGGEFLRLGCKAAYKECRRRVMAHWHHLQKSFPEFQSYRLSWIAPMLGIRESRRIVGEYVLTENDVLAGIGRQSHPDIIAITDHALDRHGASGGYHELDSPYGIPYRCLIPKGFSNLLIACRAASFSSLAASSCRLSRTMIQLGQAAGTAAALAKKLSVPPAKVPSEVLRQALRDQYVQLDWPASADLLEYLKNDWKRKSSCRHCPRTCG